MLAQDAYTATDQMDYLVNTYLYYGYLPPASTPASLHEVQSPEPMPSFSTHEATHLFNRVVDDTLLDHYTKSGRCIVPLSGGWDSRILFGAAMDRFPKDKITTLSFGAPGQLDYKIGKKIAKHYGVAHYAVDLTLHEISWEKLQSSITEAPWTYTPDAYFNNLAINTVAPGQNDIILSGFMGDALTGGHFTNKKGLDAEKDFFVRKQRKVKKRWLPRSTYCPYKSLPDISETSPLPTSEQLDICIRQSSCISSIVTPCKSLQSWSPHIGKLRASSTPVVTPFTHPEWASYWLHAPAQAKKNQNLYLSMLKQLYPELASLPSKCSLGAPRNSHLRIRIARSKRNVRRHLGKRLPMLGIKENSGINYLDYDYAFRKRHDYRKVLKKAVKMLSKNNIATWIDHEKLMDNHDTHKEDNAKIFLLIIGLALNLENEGLIEK
ncbi:asparagine synthase-related protein [Halomonas getboli]|uniref:asparagine synthase-related protein n=1 Tax=Halomonas getboli TaxID=2935862 RepID=UPI0020003328|nr:asparagine synthase-related protein [Halomonas getboli]MCK2183046.1 asparagine synthase-related protein [Halomonas getboli]